MLGLIEYLCARIIVCSNCKGNGKGSHCQMNHVENVAVFYWNTQFVQDVKPLFNSFVEYAQVLLYSDIMWIFVLEKTIMVSVNGKLHCTNILKQKLPKNRFRH